MSAQRQHAQAFVPPNDIAAEQAVLGAMLLGTPSGLDAAADLLKPGDFYREVHGELFTAMLAMHEAGTPVDVITLKDELIRRDLWDKIGGASYIFALAEVLPTSDHLSVYAQIVRKKAVLRRLIEESSETAGLAYGDPDDVDGLVSDAAKRILDTDGRKSAGTTATFKNCIQEALDGIEARFHGGAQITGVGTGFHPLDYVTGGLQRGDLIILAARPGMGKTGLAACIGLNAAMRHGARVGFFSLEMSRTQITNRLLCAEAMVDSHRVGTGILRPEEYEKVIEASGRIWEAPIVIDDTAGLSPSQIRARCGRLKADGGLDLIIVDYLQLMRADTERRDGNRVHEVTEIARSLKNIARSFNVPLLALAQLNRAVERREDKRPLLSDLRDSGGIEEVADVVAMLYRAAYYERKEGEKPDSAAAAPLEVQEVEVDIKKQRKGPLDYFKLAFLPSFVRFEDLSNREDAF